MLRIPPSEPVWLLDDNCAYCLGSGEELAYPNGEEAILDCSVCGGAGNRQNWPYTQALKDEV